MMFYWDPGKTAPRINEMLRMLAEEYPLAADAALAGLVFEPLDDPAALRVEKRGGMWRIGYGRTALAARGVGHVLADLECGEKHFFRTLGMLFDCTRGNIITVEHFKYWLRRLALMGYNLAMIYTKDAYQVPGEPYFGYMRGAYSQAEIREIDTYARKLGIEIVASIQALGHLEPILRWRAYRDVRDTSSAIMVDEPRSYELLEKMIAFWSEALSSRRIHLGMDECKDLGRGRFMDRHGYESQFDLYNRHLQRLTEICGKLKLEPVIWSDMYFRYANPDQDYYDPAARIPEAVKAAIPGNVRFSYWDYYHRDPEIYRTMLARTAELNGTKPIMASGVWTWRRFWTDHEMTRATVRPCIQACRDTGTDELIFTLWGDDGGHCDFDSAFAALAWAADAAAGPVEDEERTARLFEAVCGSDYRLQLACGDMCYTYTQSDGGIENVTLKKWLAKYELHADDNTAVVKISPCPLLWDDPLMGIAVRELAGYSPELFEKLLAEYRRLRAELSLCRGDQASGHVNYAWNILNVLVLKLELRKKLETAYAARDMHKLDTIREHDIPEVLRAIEALLGAFREQWLRSFKSFGIELMQIRLGGLTERCRELARTLKELADGAVDSIPELEIENRTIGFLPFTYHEVATGCFFV